MDIEELAEELAREDYEILEWEREGLLHCDGYELETFELDNDWRDNFADWMEATGLRNYYLEQARELFSENVNA